MTLPTMATDYDRATTLDWCAAIEAGPYESVACGERLTYHNQEMTVILSAAAALTSRLTIIPTVVIGPMHPTAWLAKQLATLDVLAAGRLMVGLGIGGRGHDYRAANSPDNRRYARLDEQVAELRRLWSGEAPFDGADPVGPSPTKPGGPPLLTAAQGPKGLARSAKWADGVCGQKMAEPIDTIGADVERFRQAWDAAGRTEAPYITSSFWYTTDADQLADLQDYAATYLAIFGPEIANWMAQQQTIAGPDALRQAVDACRNGGVDELILVPITGDIDELHRTTELIS